MGVSVLFYVPNVIGYLRVILAISAFHQHASPTRFLLLYGTSYLLDALDGHTARALSQNSNFGKVLDMITDRSTSAGLLCILCLLYPAWMFAFQLLLSLDISSHYLQMYVTLYTGADSHKAINKGSGSLGHKLMHLYYTSRAVLFFACAGNELFFVALYMRSHAKVWAGEWWLREDVWRWILWGSAPIWVFKQTTNVVQLLTAAGTIVSLDDKAKLKRA